MDYADSGLAIARCGHWSHNPSFPHECDRYWIGLDCKAPLNLYGLSSTDFCTPASCRAFDRDGSKNVEDLTAFLNMGGYATFVWPSMGIATAVLAGMAIVSIRRLRHSESALRAAEAASPVRRRRAEMEAGA